eukprot:scaffold83666_cov33-Tisochrysis_lutea.AAC.4
MVYLLKLCARVSKPITAGMGSRVNWPNLALSMCLSDGHWKEIGWNCMLDAISPMCLISLRSGYVTVCSRGHEKE